MMRFEVYRVPINALNFNFNNTRIRAELSGHVREKQIKLDPEDEDQQLMVEKILLESRFIGEVETQKLREDLQRRGQLDPVVSTKDGILIDGNRRLAIFRSLSRDAKYKDEFSELDVAVLPSDATNEELKELEMRIQMSHTFRVVYGNFNTALEFRYLYRSLGWSLDRIEELTLMQFKKTLIEDMIEIIDIVDEYLRLIPPRGKSEERYGILTKGWEPFGNLHYTLSSWKRKGLTAKELQRLKYFGFAIIHAQKSTYSDVRLFNRVLKDKESFARLKKDSDILKGKRLKSFLDPARTDRELEHLHDARETLKLSQEDPKRSLSIALRRIEGINIERLRSNDKLTISLIRSIKNKINELERRVRK